MHKIFISYAREDKAIALALAAHLRADGHEVWSDREIPIGSTWDEWIGTKLQAATCVIVVWSKASIESKWVRSEATLADERGVLFPVIVGDISPPPPFNLTQSLKLTSEPAAGQSAAGVPSNQGPMVQIVSAVGRFRLAPERPPTHLAQRLAVTVGIVLVAAVGPFGLHWYRIHADEQAKMDAAAIASKANEVSMALKTLEESPLEDNARRTQLRALGTDLQLALQRYPQAAVLHAQEIRRLRVEGRWDEAVSYGQAMAAAFRHDSDVHVQLGYVLLKRGRRGEAQAAFERAVEANSDVGAVGTAYFDLGWLHADAGKPDLAKAAFRAAFRTGSNPKRVCAEVGAQLANDEAYSDMQDVVDQCGSLK
jgi:Tfp pilus assembly protein PilF